MTWAVKDRVKGKFTQLGNNYFSVPFYCNPAFRYGRSFNQKLDNAFFYLNRDDILRTSSVLLELMWSDISRNGQ
jgi:hypothetical protein